jgi:hypothetical protein
MAEVLIKEVGAAERDGCIRLLKETFPESSDENTYKWRFEDENRPPPILLCAVANKKVVSFNSWIAWEFKYLGKRFNCYQSGESATDVGQRGKGIFSRILKFSEDIFSRRNIDFLIGFPSKMSFGLFYKAGYIPIGIYHYNIMPLFNWFKNNKLYTDTFASVLAENALYQSEFVTPVFDSQYINWRYIQNTKDYRVTHYEENGSSITFIFRIKRLKQLTEVIILDIQMTTFNQSLIKNGLKRFRTSLPKNTVLARTIINKYTHRGNALARHFPVAIKSKNYILCVKPISNNIDRNTLLNLNRWDIMPHLIDEL